MIAHTLTNQEHGTMDEDTLKIHERRLSDAIRAVEDGHTHEMSAERGSLEALVSEVRRLRALIGRYAEHVADREGTDFTDGPGYGKVMTFDELHEVAGLRRQVTGEQPTDGADA